MGRDRPCRPLAAPTMTLTTATSEPAFQVSHRATDQAPRRLLAVWTARLRPSPEAPVGRSGAGLRGRVGFAAEAPEGDGGGMLAHAISPSLTICHAVRRPRQIMGRPYWVSGASVPSPTGRRHSSPRGAPHSGQATCSMAFCSRCLLAMRSALPAADVTDRDRERMLSRGPRIPPDIGRLGTEQAIRALDRRVRRAPIPVAAVDARVVERGPDLPGDIREAEAADDIARGQLGAVVDGGQLSRGLLGRECRGHGLVLVARDLSRAVRGDEAAITCVDPCLLGGVADRKLGGVRLRANNGVDFRLTLRWREAHADGGELSVYLLSGALGGGCGGGLGHLGRPPEAESVCLI